MYALHHILIYTCTHTYEMHIDKHEWMANILWQRRYETRNEKGERERMRCQCWNNWNIICFSEYIRQKRHACCSEREKNNMRWSDRVYQPIWAHSAWNRICNTHLTMPNSWSEINKKHNQRIGQCASASASAGVEVRTKSKWIVEVVHCTIPSSVRAEMKSQNDH